MTNYERLKNSSKEEMAAIIGELMAYAKMDDIERDDWNLFTLNRDLYKNHVLKYLEKNLNEKN